MLQTKSQEYRLTYHQYQLEYYKYGLPSPQVILIWKEMNQNTSQVQRKSNRQRRVLQLASIKELKLNTVNKGKYLKLKVIHPPFKANAISLLVEDHTGKNCIFVSLYNYDTKGRHFTECFSVGTIFSVEDPLYKVSLAGWNIIRVDNQLDVVLGDSLEDKNLVKMYQQALSQQAKSNQLTELEMLRQKGLILMKGQDYVKAYGLYTNAIKICISPEDSIRFKLNKAITCSKLNLPEQYSQLSEQVLKIDPKNIKGLYHQAKAKALLGDMSYGDRFLSSKQINDDASKKDLERFLKIQRSFRSGKINWFQAIKNSETGSYYSDKVKIDKSKYGMGTFATKPIKAGELIYVEKPFLCQSFDFFTNKQNKDIIISLATELYSYSPEFRKKFNQLVSSSSENNRNRNEDRQINNNTFSEIIFNNCFSTNDIKDQLENDNTTRSRVLYSKISMFNHRCEMNCDYLNIGDSMVIFCIADIQPGEELFISYKVISEYRRRKQILHTWAIECECIFCTEQSMVSRKRSSKKYESRQMIKFKLMERLQTEQLMEFYDYDAFKFVLFDLKDKKKGATMLRRILPMSEKESQELVGSD